MSAARSAEWRQACGRVHARAKQLGLDDDARRDIQRRAVGKESCAEMTAAELRRVLSEMNRAARPGARDRAPRRMARSVARPRAPSARSSGASARRLREKKDARPSARELDAKLLALWISGWHLGVVRDRTDDGLTAWLRRRFRVEVPSWPDFPAKARAVEGMKAWLAREAGVDWSPYVELGAKGEAREVDRPQARVIEAQWRILCAAGVMRIDSLAALGAYACRHAGIGRADSHLALDRAQTIALMRDLGAKVRRAQIKVVPEPGA